MDTQDTKSSEAAIPSKEISSKETVTQETVSKETISADERPVDSIAVDAQTRDAHAGDENAIDSVSREKAANPSRVDPLTLVDDSYWPARALRSLRESRFSEAISLCEAGLQDDDPAPISGFLIKAQALASLGRLKDSLSTLTDALRADPENQMAFKLLGDIHFAEGEEEAAMSYYRRIHSQRSQEKTIGIALEIGTPLSATLKKVFMSRTASVTISRTIGGVVGDTVGHTVELPSQTDTSHTGASEGMATQKAASQAMESEITPGPIPVERRPYQVEEQKAPEGANENIDIEKIEEPTSGRNEPATSGALKKPPSDVGRSSERVQTSEKPDNPTESTEVKPENPPTQSSQAADPVGRNHISVPPIEKTKSAEFDVSAEPVSAAQEPTASGGAPKQSAKTPTQSAERPMKSVTLKRKAETPAPTETNSAKDTAKDDIAETASRITLPESFQTETMADIFMRQGLHFEAAEILRKLHTRNPSDSLKTKLEEAESGRAGK